MKKCVTCSEILVDNSCKNCLRNRLPYFYTLVGVGTYLLALTIYS